jgi:hypothetical protein
MSGLQTIINKASSLTIDRRKVVGVQITRNEIPRTSLTPTKQPWRFVLEMPSSLRYYNNRDLLEELDRLDRYQPQLVSFGDNPCINWIFRYQGTMNTTMINNLRVFTPVVGSGFTGNQLTLTNLPTIPSTRVLFEPNDLIQIGNNPYPFTSTTQVLRGTGSTVTITTNRPNIISSGVNGSSITVGSDCTFNVFCPNMPTYKLIPGGYVSANGVTVNNALIEFSDEFTLYEWVGTA